MKLRIVTEPTRKKKTTTQKPRRLMAAARHVVSMQPAANHYIKLHCMSAVELILCVYMDPLVPAR